MEEFPIEVKLEILAKVPSKDLQRVCASNTSMRYICNDPVLSEHLYYDRAEYWYPELIRYKSRNQTWKDFNKEIERFNVIMEDPVSVMSSGKRLTLTNIYNINQQILKEIEQTELYGDYDPVQYANKYAEQGNLLVLKLLASMEPPIYADTDGFLAALHAYPRGLLEVAKFIRSTGKVDESIFR